MTDDSMEAAKDVDRSGASDGSGINVFGEFVPGWVWHSRLSGLVARAKAIDDAIGKERIMCGDPVSGELKSIASELMSLCEQWDQDIVTVIPAMSQQRSAQS